MSIPVFFKKIQFLSALIIPVLSYSQDDENWDVYLAQYEKGPGSVILNMQLKNVAPVKNFPFAIITGVTFTGCSSDGLPLENAFTGLYEIADSVKSCIDRLSKNIHAGSFTYQCERLDYFYVSDTTGIRASLNTLYAKRFKGYKPYTNVKHDPKWDGYLTFLYPNEETYEYMSNQKVLAALEEGGDKLKQPRQVDHWIYFASEKDQNCFIAYATSKKFKIESKEKTDKGDKPLKLQISRTDKVDISSISEITGDLRKQAIRCNGEYDGWETFLVK